MKTILFILSMWISLTLFSQNESGICEPVWEKVTYGFDPGMRGLFCGDLEKDGANEIVVLADGGYYWFVLRYDKVLNEYMMIWASDYYSNSLGLMDINFIEVLDCDLDSELEILVSILGRIEIWSGPTLELESVIETEYFAGTQPIFLADADNDGDQELVFNGYDSTRLFTPGTYECELVFPLGASYLMCGNVDEDDLIELVYTDKVAVLLPGSTVPVIKWNIPSHEYARTLIGDTDNDGMDEIISCYDTLKVFDADLKQLKYSMNYGHTELNLLSDINDDGQKEILLTDMYDGYFICLSALTGSMTWMIDSMKCWSDVLFADSDNDNFNELILSYTSPTSGYRLSVLDPFSLEPEWQSPLTAGPLHFKVADVDADMDDEIIIVLYEDHISYVTTHIEVINATTKETEWNSNDLLTGSACHDFDINDIDGDGIPEIILSGRNELGKGVLYVIDGQAHTLEEEYEIDVQYSIANIQATDVDNDANYELIYKISDVIEILEPQNISIMKTYPDCGFGKYFIGNVDADESKEIININDNIYFIDLSTDEITKTSQKGFQCIAPYDFENDGVLEVIAGTESGKIAILRYNAPVQWLQVDHDKAITSILPIASADPNLPLIVHISGGILYFMTMQGEILASDSQGGKFSYGIDVSDQNGSKQIFSGYHYKLSEYGTECFPCFFFNSSITNTPSHCGSPDGTSTINVKGGKPPYTYEWNTGNTSVTATNLAPGNYFCTVTDALGCTTNSQTDVSIVNPFVDGITTIPDLTNTSECDGKAVISLNSAVPPYQYSLNGSAQTELPDTLAGLCEGEHHLLISDALGCTTDTTFFIESILGLEESYLKCKVYPIPTSDKVVIELPITLSGVGQLINLQGTVVLTFNVNSLRTEVDLKDISQGYYFINLIADKGINFREKIVKTQ